MKSRKETMDQLDAHSMIETNGNVTESTGRPLTSYTVHNHTHGIYITGKIPRGDLVALSKAWRKTYKVTLSPPNTKCVMAFAHDMKAAAKWLEE